MSAHCWPYSWLVGREVSVELEKRHDYLIRCELCLESEQFPAQSDGANERLDELQLE
jgi:hypothetical protein